MAVDYDRLDSIFNATMNRRNDRERKRLAPPLVRLWDGNWELRGRVAGEFSASFEWVLNDTGAGEIVLPYNHHLAMWAAHYWDRDTQNIHVTVDKDGARWSGRVSEVTTAQNSEGLRTVTIKALHDYEELKHIQVWPNPFLPAAVQFPKAALLAGPSVYVLKLALFMNLFRLQGNLWRLPDNPLTFEGWTQGLNYKQWPILVKPSLLTLDDSQWTVVSSRFKDFHEMAKDTLADGQLMVVCRRWLIGDPQPWKGANLERNGQLIIDIVDKSGWYSQTAVGGTIAGGLVRSLHAVGEDLVNEWRVATNEVADTPEYGFGDWLGSAPQSPWVVYRTEGKVNTAETTSFTYQPATVGQVTVGGHSMPGVNEGISALVQLVGNLATAFWGFAPQMGGIADTVLKPLYEDVFLAFMSLKNPARTVKLGWSHYYENFEDGADKAYTLSSILALRAGFWKTRSRTFHKLSVGNGAPYLVGDNGEGHFFLGDRVGAQIPGAPDGRVVVEQVSKLELEWAADKPHEWEITVGDMDGARDGVEYALNKIKTLTGAIHDLGVM